MNYVDEKVTIFDERDDAKYVYFEEMPPELECILNAIEGAYIQYITKCTPGWFIELEMPTVEIDNFKTQIENLEFYRVIDIAETIIIN